MIEENLGNCRHFTAAGVLSRVYCVYAFTYIPIYDAHMHTERHDMDREHLNLFNAKLSALQ